MKEGNPFRAPSLRTLPVLDDLCTLIPRRGLSPMFCVFDSSYRFGGRLLRGVGRAA